MNYIEDQMFNLKRLLNTELGKFLISIILGIGLATLFRKTCKDKQCIMFNGPVISEVDGKTYQFGEVCYKYNLKPHTCDPNLQTVDLNDDVAQKILDNNPPPANEVKPESNNGWFGGFFSK
jgi:hypothetical protein